MAKRLRRFGVGLVCLCALQAVLSRASADGISDFYRGKTVRIVVGSEAGGAYDLYARFIARRLPNYVPGNPAVIVENMVGAGSMMATNYVSSSAPQDGTVIGALSAALPFQPMLDARAAKFDVLKTNWLPVPTGDTFTVSVWHAVPVQSFLDMRNRETVFGTTGPNSAPAFFIRLFNDIFHTKIRMIHGYPGSSDQFRAMERGEVEGHGSATWTQVKTAYPEWLREGKLRILLQYGKGPNPELPNVPYARDLLTSPDDKQLLDLATAQTFMARPYLMGPGVPKERVQAIDKAFMDVFKDEGFVEDVKKAKYDLDPLSGEQVRAIIEQAYGAPASMVERLKRLYAASDN